MALEPENERMDELLKSAARKRRDEAGPPFTMHPVTRKALQDEVARVYGTAREPTPGWWQRLITLWPRVGFATLVVLLGIMLVILPKQEPSQELARTVPLATDAERAELSDKKLEGPARSISVGDEAGKLDFLEAKRSESAEKLERDRASSLGDTRELRQEMDVAVAAKDQPAIPPLKPGSMPRDNVGQLAKQSADQLKSAEAGFKLKAEESLRTVEAASAPSAQASPSSNVLPGAEVSLQHRFYSASDGITRTRYTQAPAQQAAVVAGGAATNTPQTILNYFDFEQTGDQVRITDADGSVYQGRVLQEASSSDVSGATLATTSGREPQPTQAGKKLGELQRGTELLQVQQRTFRATGTNRTLRKAVTIEANLSVPEQSQLSVAAPAVNAPAGATSGTQAGQAQVDSYRRLQSVPTIRGRAQVGTNQAFPIQAVPAQR